MSFRMNIPSLHKKPTEYNEYVPKIQSTYYKPSEHKNSQQNGKREKGKVDVIPPFGKRWNARGIMWTVHMICTNGNCNIV